MCQVPVVLHAQLTEVLAGETLVRAQFEVDFTKIALLRRTLKKKWKKFNVLPI